MSHKSYNLSEKNQISLLLTLGVSDLLRNSVILIHALALAACMANALALTVKVVLCAFILMHCRFAVRRLNTENHTIRYSEALGWELSGGRDFASIQILKSTVITTQVLVLHFKYSFQAQSWKSFHVKSLLILNDALADDDYRFLIVKLKTTAIK
jgi:hypothetical protein